MKRWSSPVSPMAHRTAFMRVLNASSAAVEVARARAIASGRRNVSFREGDAAEIKFDEPFDASSAALSSYFKMILRICSQSLPSTWGQEA
jgi:hypothetical protein